jgi:hypothetical protein
MAESWRAKANRYLAGDFTKAELMGAVGILLVDQAIDVATFGRLNALKGKAFVRVALPLVMRGVPVMGRAGVGTAGRLGGTYITAGAAIVVGIHERERIKQLLDQGYDIIEPIGRAATPILEEAAQITTTAFPTGPGIQAPPFVSGLITKKRKPSQFNKAIKAGMIAVRKSTSYGGKGKIKPAKKAFSVVVKLASAKKKKKKAPKKGIRRLIWNAMKGLT